MDNEFGEWLVAERTKQGWTRAELSEATGISLPQIYNIELGRSLNPQTRTKDKLYEVLGTRPSNEVLDEVEADALIPDVGELLDFDPFNPIDVPELAGVYVFYDLTGRPVYVGKSSNIRRRVANHEEKFWFKRPVVQSASYVEINDQALRHKVEKIMIKFLKNHALLNKQNVDRE